ncbi:hypothetical protein FIU82_07865 [Pseudoalteromonas sp. THAF3]|uniref:DUF4209 domain-containing protein n=1 Tax=unclassified Pseudoalteromonas TaxID=194690 RepID=UPI001268AF86|nr:MULTISPECIES: DUF4209 domain-containing protein [unclassified Pseudoalteromonas]MCG7564964.1 DUF4209 domain-containing protein [Pseudoalteromonas sp. CnMc7-15]QFU04930.1 hypothetical protein FIU82_07865 [Pseudoalteromonas sp. THAF3]
MSHIEAATIANEIIATCDDFDCVYYQSTLRQKAEDATIGLETRGCLKVLASVASYHSKREDSASPFGPLMQTPEGRSPIPEDLTEDQLSLLQETHPYLESSALKARVLDVLWLRLRSPDNAEQAINEYINCARKYFDLEHWTHSAEYAERALRLSALFRKKNSELFDSVAELFLSWVQNHITADKKFITARSIQLLLDFGAAEAEELLEASQTAANIAESVGDHHRAENYWKLAVSAARKAKNEEAANAAQTALAETYVSNAKGLGGGMSAAHWMQQAIEAYKAVPNSKGRRDELYTELLEFQKQSLDEMGKFEKPLDISDCVSQTVETIEGKPFREALFVFAFSITSVPNYEKLKQQAEELAKKHPLSHLFGATHLDHEGKVIAKSPGSFDTGEVSSHNLYRSAALNHQISVAGCILPASDIIRVEHPFTLTEFEALTTNNPFVAPGQERMWAQGLLAGLDGKYEVALPIIIPLLENSLRNILKQSGVRVSTLNTHGVQEELRISAILDHEVALELFGYDLIMDLKGLLQERTYANLRNVVSHGLGSTGTYYSAPSIYLWWLCFRLVLTPYAKQRSEPESPEI